MTARRPPGAGRCALRCAPANWAQVLAATCRDARAPARRPHLDLLARARPARQQPAPRGRRGRGAAACWSALPVSRGFYEQLALEELGQRITVPRNARAPLTDRRKEAARQNPGLRRALYAIAIGLRQRGRARMELQPPTCTSAAAWTTATCWQRPTWPAHAEVWDRCINTSERTKADASIWSSAFPCRSRTRCCRAANQIGARPGLRLRPDPAGKPLHHGRAVQRRRLRPDAGHARHRTLDRQENRPHRLPAATRSPTATPTWPLAPATSSWCWTISRAPCHWPLPPTTPAPADPARGAGQTGGRHPGGRHLGREHARLPRPATTSKRCSPTPPTTRP